MTIAEFIVECHKLGLDPRVSQTPARLWLQNGEVAAYTLEAEVIMRLSPEGYVIHPNDRRTWNIAGSSSWKFSQEIRHGGTPLSKERISRALTGWLDKIREEL